MSDRSQATAASGEAVGADAYSAFYAAEYANAVRLVWLLTRRSADSEDLTQEGFLRLRSNFDALTSPKAYLRMVLVNLCKERTRREGREAARTRLVATSWATPPPPDLRLLDLVVCLPYRQRAALVLRYWADLTDADIADALAVRETTVRSIVHRANATLRKELDRDH